MTDSEPNPTHHTIDGAPGLDAVEWRESSSPTLFLLHCTNQHTRYWDPLVRLLEPYRVVELDARGLGASEWGGSGGYDPDHYVADLEGAIDQFAERRCDADRPLDRLARVHVLGGDPPRSTAGGSVR